MRHMFIVCIMTFLALAQQHPTAIAAEKYDPNIVYYEPTQQPVSECGFSFGADKTWITESTSKSMTGGVMKYTYTFASDPKVVRRPFDAVTFQPAVHVLVDCRHSVRKDGTNRTGEDLDKIVKRTAEIYREGTVAKGEYANVSQVQSASVPGFDTTYLIEAEIPPKAGTPFKTRGLFYSFFARHDDLLVTGSLQIIDPTGGEPVSRKGTTVQGMVDGEVIEAVLENDVTLYNKVYYGSRSLSEDKALLMSLLKSFR
ncbi:hypothetical protein [Rhizobium sp. L1K21]|uniref:hypothetical protein n=1 Tax=Rhizobium sp. L1K21 TaxID=2954933 RepID=UPI00209311D6|nr:hypothetical protein [Rhizobium sp. L1K21]MCO6185892.1 hypothetical protein [Rhizobium sp. L1K21]